MELSYPNEIESTDGDDEQEDNTVSGYARKQQRTAKHWSEITNEMLTAVIESECVSDEQLCTRCTQNSNLVSYYTISGWNLNSNLVSYYTMSGWNLNSNLVSYYTMSGWNLNSKLVCYYTMSGWNVNSNLISYYTMLGWNLNSNLVSYYILCQVGM